MKQERKIVLAVPNISEGRRRDVIEKIVAPLKNVEGVKLISFEAEEDFNRTVIYAIGEVEPIKIALLAMAQEAYSLIDMEQQKGSHPRIGALDTMPLFPFKNISLEECQALAEEIGQAILDKYQVPVYFSGENSRNDNRRNLAFIRKGQYEGLKEVAHTESRKPDLGAAKLHPTAGATIVSAAKEGLTAYNIFLGTENLAIAKEIARGVRGPSGGFSTVRAVGVKFPATEGVVVSMNLFDCNNTPIYRVFEFVKQEAKRFGVTVTGSEIVGPVKLAHLLNSLEYYLGLKGFNTQQILETHLFEA